MRGASQMQVMSTCTISPPRSRSQAGGMFEEQLRGRAAPARVGRREVHADIALGDGAEQRVGQACKPTSASLWPMSFL